MQTILAPLDGSRLAEQVLPHVEVLAPLLGARVCLLHVVPKSAHITMVGDTILGFVGIDEPPERYDERERRVWEIERQRAESYLEPRAARLRAAGLDVAIAVRLGPPPETIVEAAKHWHANFIAMATHGASGLRRWTLGSVTDKVVQATTTPILVVRGTEGAREAPHAPKRILVPLDGSSLAKQALPAAANLALHAPAELILVRVVAPPAELYPGFRRLEQPIPDYDDIVVRPRERAAQDLEVIAANLSRENIAATGVVAVGHPAEAIVDEAARLEVDLIVMATHGYGGLKRWAIGSVADKVLHATTTPLVLVRAR
jgi:nucleotide-binding universal stress UspA family protein